MSAYTIIFAPIAQATRSEQVVERLKMQLSLVCSKAMNNFLMRQI